MAVGCLPKTGRCQRPGCRQSTKRDRVYCGKACRSTDFSRRSTGVQKQPWKPRETRCAVCGATIRKRWPSELPKTCSRRCMGLLFRETMAAERLEHLTKKGIQDMTPIEAFSWGYKTGYARRVQFERRKAAA